VVDGGGGGAEEFVAEGGAGGGALFVGEGGGIFAGVGEGARDDGVGDAAGVGPVDGGDGVGCVEDGGGGGAGGGVEERDEGGENGVGSGPVFDVGEGEAFAVGGVGEGVSGAGEPVVAVIHLRDGKGREGFEGEFDLGGGVLGGLGVGHGDGAHEELRVGQEHDVGGGSFEKFERHVGKG
jgi:hypothetical protein